MRFTILEKYKGEADDTATKNKCDTEDLTIRRGGTGKRIEDYPIPNKPTMEGLEKYAQEMINGFNTYARAINQREREIVKVIIND